MHSPTRSVSRVIRLVAAGLLVAALNTPDAATAQQTTAQPPVPASQLPLPHSGSTLERYFESLRRDFEIRRAVRYYLRSGRSGPEKVDDTVRSIMALDTDKDGRVSVSEAGKFASPEMKRNLGFPGEAGRARRALTLKSGTKGEISRQDHAAAGEALFRKIDADHDGKISRGELDDYRRTQDLP